MKEERELEGEGKERRGRGRGREKGRKKETRLRFSIDCMVQCVTEILLLTSLSCCPPTISRQYGSQQSSQDKKEYIQ